VEEILEELRAKYDELWSIDTKFGPVVFKCPAPIEHRKFMSRIAKGQDLLPDVVNELAKKVVVYPDAAAFSKILDSRPGLAQRIVGDAMRVAGDEEATEGKKL